MAQLSRCIMDITETDYNDASVTYTRVRPKFDGVVDGFTCSYPVGQDIPTAKTEIKAKMITAGITRDSEV